MQIQSREIPFIWTLQRHRRWHCGCRRAYFYHYYAARGGHEIGVAGSETEQLHFCRNLLSVAEYRRRVLYRAIRNIFYQELPAGEFEGEPPPPRSLTAAVLTVFETEWEEMLLGLPVNDHRKPMLRELTLPQCDCRKVKKQLRTSLLAEAAAVEKGDWQFMLEVPPVNRRHLESPLFLSIGELECCMTPLAALTQYGEYWIIEAASLAPEEYDMVATLHRYHAMNQTGFPPERVRSLRWDLPTGRLLEFGTLLNVSEALRTIRGDLNEMLAAVRENGIAAMEDFPPDENECAGCRFRLFCKK